MAILVPIIWVPNSKLKATFMFALQVLRIPFQLAQLEKHFSAVSFFFPPFMEELTSVWKCFVHNNTCITETELLTWIARNRGVMTPVSTRYCESCGVWRAIWPQAPAATSFTAGSNSASIEIRGWIAPQFTTACDKGGECFATALSIHAAAFLLSRCASLQ